MLLPLLLALSAAIGIIIGVKLVPVYLGIENQKLNKLDEVMSLVKEFYVDSIPESIEEEAIAELLHQLDPHSVFIPASESRAANEPLEGEFEGIGVEFNLIEDTVYIVNVVSGGPSDRVGLRAGDRLITVNDTAFAGTKLTNERVIKTLKGPRNTKVKVGILRYGSKDLKEYIITRGTIPYFSIDATYMIRDEIGYIKISRFAATTTQELRKAIDQLTSEGMRSLVLDLRGNPGGYLTAATQVCDEFLDGRKLLVYTEGRNNPKRTYTASNTGKFEKGKLVILIDEQSASASEIVAGAVQDWDRGIIVGRRSYGKGLVQEPYTLRDGAMLRLTVSRYYTPTGRSIQKPYDDGYVRYQQEVSERWRNGELENSDSLKTNEDAVFTTPNGRKVFGGGGIYPDIFVSIDTSFDRQLLFSIYQKAAQRRFVYHYLDVNRSKMKQWQSGKSFARGFNWSITDEDLFKNQLRAEGIRIEESSWQKTRIYLLNEMKAIMARQLFGANAYFEVSNEVDKDIETAIRAFSEYNAKIAAR